MTRLITIRRLGATVSLPIRVPVDVATQAVNLGTHVYTTKARFKKLMKVARRKGHAK